MASRNGKNGYIDKSESDDDSSSLEGGDLGLGFGLKPGGMPRSPELPPRRSVHLLENIDCDGCASVTSSEPDLHHDVDRFTLMDNNEKDLKICRSHSLRLVVNEKRNGSGTGRLLLGQKMKQAIFAGRRTKSEFCPGEINRKSRSCDSVNDGSLLSPENGLEDFPKFADVPLGTSIRQQKKLFEHDIHELYKCSKDLNAPMTACWHCVDEMDMEDKLKRTEQEVEILRNELERCQKQLDTKYKAIQVLHKQSQVAQCEHDVSEHKIRELTHIMEQIMAKTMPLSYMTMLTANQQEINKLQFELEYRQSTLMDSQQTWAQRFDRAMVNFTLPDKSVCQENVSLVQLLEDRTEELRRMYAEKMALARERDELLALLDVKERLKYEQNKQTNAGDEAYSEFSSNELAVLGACNCRGTNPDPCGCAYAAANLRKENIKLKEEIEIHKKRREEAYSTVDAYRMAFEEQLFRNKALTMKIAELSVPSPNKKKKAMSALKWLIKQLNDDEPPRRRRTEPTDENNEEEANKEEQTSPNDKLINDISGCQSEQEIIQVLLEKLNDKSEALAQQKIAARMLASRTQELEEKLSHQEEEKPAE